jgi:hypothetical protein
MYILSDFFSVEYDYRNFVRVLIESVLDVMVLIESVLNAIFYFFAFWLWCCWLFNDRLAISDSKFCF